MVCRASSVRIAASWTLLTTKSVKVTPRTDAACLNSRFCSEVILASSRSAALPAGFDMIADPEATSAVIAIQIVRQSAVQYQLLDAAP
jgi:hypothetical protein